MAIVVRLCDQFISRTIEIVQQVFIDVGQLGQCFLVHSINKFFRLGYSDLLKLYTCCFLDSFQVHLLLFGVESYHLTCFTGSSSSACSVYVAFTFSRWLQLDDQVDIWNINASSCYICCNQDIGLTFSKLSQNLLSLMLIDITVDCLQFDFRLLRIVDKVISVSLCLCEYDGLTFASSMHE